MTSVVVEGLGVMLGKRTCLAGRTTFPDEGIERRHGVRGLSMPPASHRGHRRA